jgi:hypothetical protein
LGEYLSALVDGELTGSELDRASAHLAACERCRAEAAALRDLKRQLRGLGAAAWTGAGPAAGSGTGPAAGSGTGSGDATARNLDEALTERLLAMAGLGGLIPFRRLRRDAGRPRAAFRVYSDGRRRPDGTRRDGSRPGGSRPRGTTRPGRPQRSGPGNTQRLARPWLALSAEAGQRLHARGGRLRWRPRGWHLIWSAVSLVVVGIGAAAFSMGGNTTIPGPRVTPPVDTFSVEYAITSGGVPVLDPTAQVPSAESTP